MPDDLQPQVPVPAQPQPAFYSLTPDPVPAPEPFYKKRHFGMVVGAVVVAMLIGAGIIVFAANLIRVNNQAKQEIATKAAAVKQMVEDGTPQTEAARENGFIDGCQGQTGEEYANCVSLIAFDAMDSKACGALTDAEKEACTNGVLLLKLQAGKDYKACDQITDEVMKTACQAAVTQSAVQAGECVLYGVAPVNCEAKIALDAVVAAGDPASCVSLAEGERAKCQDIFNSTDADADGLTLAEEHTHGTSDQQTDTDGDGYTDGEEVASGHDPLKK